MELSLRTRLTPVNVSALDSQGQSTDFIASPDLTSNTHMLCPGGLTSRPCLPPRLHPQIQSNYSVTASQGLSYPVNQPTRQVGVIHIPSVTFSGSCRSMCRRVLLLVLTPYLPSGRSGVYGTSCLLFGSGWGPLILNWIQKPNI